MPGLIFDPTATFRTTRDIETDAETGYRTGSVHCVLPAQTMLRLRSDGLVEPRKQVRYELIDPPQGEVHIATIFPAAVEAGIFEDPERHPDKWEKVVYLDSITMFMPENASELEQQLIPQAIRTHIGYEGLYFLLRLTMLGDGLDYIPSARGTALRSNQRLYAKGSFETDGLRDDGVAVACRVPAETILVTRHAVEREHLVAGWELTSDNHAWWRTSTPRTDELPMGWEQAQRVCPSMFLADSESRRRVQSDREWHALLVPTAILGTTLVPSD
jgi:hypothetical protein